MNEENTLLDLSRIPSTIESINVFKIYNTGELIRQFISNGLPIDFKNTDLFWKYYQQTDIYENRFLFKCFLGNLVNKVFTVCD